MDTSFIELDAKPVGFFLKIGLAWHNSLTRASPASLRFQPRSSPFVWLFMHTQIRKNRLFCSLSESILAYQSKCSNYMY